MTCHAPGGHCDQSTCDVDGRCAWPEPPAKAWGGDFGSEYAKRSPGNPEANVAMFKRALGFMESKPNQIGSCWQPHRGIGTILELGAGVGSNIVALRKMFKDALIAAVEINPTAIERLIATGAANEMYQDSLLTWTPPRQYDLAFTKGVMIHIPTEDLKRAYGALYRASRKYILVAEYYAPTRTEIIYRGRAGMLWKDDFAGQMLDTYPDLRMIDYGFHYHRDQHPQDDITWFLMEKRNAT